MGLIDLNQETYARTLLRVLFIEYNIIEFNIYGSSIWSWKAEE